MTTKSLAALLAEPGIIVAPGAYDALSAKLAARAGARAVYMTGFGVAGSTLGLPDIGLLSATEMADRVRAIADAAAPAPLIADGDNGHGGPLNAVTKRLEEIYATLVKGEGLPASEPRVTFQNYNEIVGLPELLASAARLEDETK